MKPKVNVHSLADQLNSARTLLRSGNIAGAERTLNALQAKNSKNPEVLGLLATTVYLRGEKKQSKILWKKSLKNTTQPLIFLTNLHAFLHMLLVREGDRIAAAKQASRRLPAWPITQQPNTNERDMLIELADMLATLDQVDSASKLLEGVSKALPTDAKLTSSLGLIQMMQNKFAAALKTLSAADHSIQPKTDLSLLVRIYQCAHRLNDEELKTSLQHRVANAYPVYIAPKLSGQRKNILIISGRPNLSASVHSNKDIFISINYPTQIANKLANEFHFSSIFSYIKSSRESKNELPNPDIIINNEVNGEKILANDKLSTIADLVDSFGVPVVNHPRKAILTTREHTAKLIGDIPGVLVPTTIPFSKDQKSNTELINEIEAHFDYPLITRTISTQEGKGMVKIDDQDALARTLPSIPNKFYVTKFIDSRDESGLYSKIRAVIIGDEIHIARVEYSTHWKINARKSDDCMKFYQDHPHLLVTGDRICSNPDGELGPSIMQSLEEIRLRIPLEIFGVDFDVNNDGEIVVYEANASMNLLSTAKTEVDYPVYVEERLLSAFRSFLHNL